jgi:hypothetical protein
MNPPIIIVEGLSLYIFNDIQKAQNYMEPIDVENNEFSVYDRFGNLLKPKIEYNQHQTRFLWFSRKVWREEVILEKSDPPIRKDELLREILTKNLTNFEFDDQWLSNATLDELVMKALEIHGL